MGGMGIYLLVFEGLYVHFAGRSYRVRYVLC